MLERSVANPAADIVQHGHGTSYTPPPSRKITTYGTRPDFVLSASKDKDVARQACALICVLPDGAT